MTLQKPDRKIADVAPASQIDPIDQLREAAGELRRGEAVLLRDGGAAALAFAAETFDDFTLAAARSLTESAPELATTPRRAAALGLVAETAASGSASGAIAVLVLPRSAAPASIRALADPTAPDGRADEPWLAGLRADFSPPDRLAALAVELARTARILPAIVLFRLASAEAARAGAAGLVAVEPDALALHRAGAEAFRRLTEAALPLADAEDARIVAFAPDEHLAIVIGRPEVEAGRPVLVRLHSACFTGDLLGSLRCDCGDQLRGAIRAIAADGGGVLVYLMQEGRGIGLVNKLRAYRLQDAGYDTFDANHQLGFEADERAYRPAALILRNLGFSRVRLLTNNPDKVAALVANGIEVVERVPHRFAANRHNQAYLDAKASKAGHLLG